MTPRYPLVTPPPGTRGPRPPRRPPPPPPGIPPRPTVPRSPPRNAPLLPPRSPITVAPPLPRGFIWAPAESSGMTPPYVTALERSRIPARDVTAGTFPGGGRGERSRWGGFPPGASGVGGGEGGGCEERGDDGRRRALAGAARAGSLPAFLLEEEEEGQAPQTGGFLSVRYHGFWSLKCNFTSASSIGGSFPSFLSRETHSDANLALRRARRAPSYELPRPAAP